MMTISIEGAFRLLDYNQLFWAKLLGGVAITISVGIAVTSLVIQIFLPIKITDKQFQTIKDINNAVLHVQEYQNIQN